MRTTEELALAVHTRATALRQRREKERLVFAGLSSALLGVALLVLVGSLGGLWHRPLAENYAGASMLSDCAGGYVLAAVAAFMAGAVITVICIRKRNGGERK